MGIALTLIRHFVLSRVCVCVPHTVRFYVHEACQLMDLFVNTECNVIVSFCVFSLPLSVSSPSILSCGCSLLYLIVFPPSSSVSHTFVSPYPLSLSCFLSLSLSSPTLSLSRCGSSFLSYSLTLSPGRGRRKLVDCPQLLDVDDMVKMREPDWKCVYTYLQEFYRGLVTKGLVKTKNST